MLTTTTAVPVPSSNEEQKTILDMKELECESRIRKEGDATVNSSGVCSPVWDGILCWNRANAGQTLEQPCPSYIAGFNQQESAFKLCTTEGRWFDMYGTGSWTNFSQCFGPEATVIYSVGHFNDSYVRDHLPTVRIISKVGYAVSLISLLAAFTILISIKKLRCPRNVLHMHLFVSFIARASMLLLKEALLPEGLNLNEKAQYFYKERESTSVCKVIVSLGQYCIMANYSWILMEGLYLHNLIFQALFADSSSITLYIILGWGLPAIFVVPWTICRAMLEDTLCWTTHDNDIVYLLIRGPTAACVVVNFVLFVNIVRVLFRKLQSSVCEETQTYRRWAKSTLVLIPLFGVHYSILFVLQFSPRHTDEVVWLYCDQLFSTFNGFFVAILYCFLNGEVRSELGRKWKRFSFEEDILERWQFLGHICNGCFPRNGRHYRPRGSCYSSTSCTVDSVVHGNSTDKKRIHTILKGSSQETRVNREEIKAFNSSSRENITNVKDDPYNELQNCNQLKNTIANSGKDRRWSASDCDVENNALELKSMATQNDIVTL